jgi:ethanolamine ammonia-lyase small subunit
MKKKIVLVTVSSMLIFGSTNAKAMVVTPALESSINDLGSSMMESEATVNESAKVETFAAKKKKTVKKKTAPKPAPAPKPVTSAS